jgi:Mg/Co/Ni transporter MgtE
MPKKIRVGKPFNDVKVIDAERRLKREELIGTLSKWVVGTCLLAIATTGSYWAFTMDYGPIGAVTPYAASTVAAIVAALVGTKPWLGNSS